MAEKTSLDPMRLASSCEPNQAASYTSPSIPPAPYPGPILPLDGRKIRILVLEPVTDVTDSGPLQLVGSLVVRDLDERPDFAALSYVWDETTATPPHHIKIRDGPGGDRLGSIPLTDNCFHALAELQKDPTRRTLWVDAVCINQADCTEKGHQVRYMGDIYSLAKTTFVWLGPGHTGTNRAMRYLKYLGRSSKRLKIGLAMAVTAEQRKEQVAHYNRLFWQDVRGMRNANAIVHRPR